MINSWRIGVLVLKKGNDATGTAKESLFFFFFSLSKTKFPGIPPWSSFTAWSVNLTKGRKSVSLNHKTRGDPNSFMSEVYKISTCKNNLNDQLNRSVIEFPTPTLSQMELVGHCQSNVFYLRWRKASQDLFLVPRSNGFPSTQTRQDPNKRECVAFQSPCHGRRTARDYRSWILYTRSFRLPPN